MIRLIPIILALSFGLTFVPTSACADDLPECTTTGVKSMNAGQIRAMLSSCLRRQALIADDIQKMNRKITEFEKTNPKDSIQMQKLINERLAYHREFTEMEARRFNLRYHRALLSMRDGDINAATEPPNPDVANTTEKKLSIQKTETPSLSKTKSSRSAR